MIGNSNCNIYSSNYRNSDSFHMTHATDRARSTIDTSTTTTTNISNNGSNNNGRGQQQISSGILLNGGGLGTGDQIRNVSQMNGGCHLASMTLSNGYTAINNLDSSQEQQHDKQQQQQQQTVQLHQGYATMAQQKSTPQEQHQRQHHLYGHSLQQRQWSITGLSNILHSVS